MSMTTKSEKESKSKAEVKAILNQIVSPRELARTKVTAYRKYVIEILNKVIRHIEDIKGDDIPSGLSDLLFWSPAGDCMGSENYVIDFGIEDVADISQAAVYISKMLKFANGAGDKEALNFIEPKI